MRLTPALLMVLFFLGQSAAAGESAPAADMERARRAYAEGEAAYKLGKFDAAAKQFEEAYQIVKAPSMLFSVGQSYRRLYETGKDFEHLRKAVELYRGYLREAAANADKRAVAEQLLGQLEKTLAAERQRRKQELVASASGREGLFLAEQLLADGEIKDAALVLDRVLASRGKPRDLLVAGIQKRAMLAGRLGQRSVAVDLFERALSLDPGFFLPDETDAVTQASFAEAKRRMAGKPALAITHVPPGNIAPGERVRIAVKVEADPRSMISELAVFYRIGEGRAYSLAKAPARLGQGVAWEGVEMPAAFLATVPSGGRVEYYLVALSALADELAVLGGPREPFVFTVGRAPERHPVVALRESPPAVTPWHKRWWPWALIGGAVVAGLGAGFVSTRAQPANPPAVNIPTR